MLHIVGPAPNVFIAIREDASSSPMHFSHHEFSLIPALVWPEHDSMAIDVVLGKLAFVELAGVSEIILAHPVKLAILKVTFVEASFELEASLS